MIRINLAPPERRKVRRPGGPSFRIPIPEFNLAIGFGAVYVVALLVGGLWWNHLRSREVDVTARVKVATEELNVLKSQVAQASKVREQLADLLKRVDAIQELTKTQTRLLVMLDSLADTVPQELWLTTLEERGAMLRVTGMAFTPSAVADFMSNLRSSGRFKDIDVVISRQDLNKIPRSVTFEVTCRFES